VLSGSKNESVAKVARAPCLLLSYVGLRAVTVITALWPWSHYRTVESLKACALFNGRTLYGRGPYLPVKNGRFGPYTAANCHCTLTL